MSTYGDTKVKLAFVDMPEVGDPLDEARLAELGKFSKNPVVVETTPAGRKFAWLVMLDLKDTRNARYAFADLCDILLGEEIDEDDEDDDAKSVAVFMEKNRCVVEFLIKDEMSEMLLHRIIISSNGGWFDDLQTWTDNNEHDKPDLADNPSLGKVIDDNIGAYLIARAAQGLD